MLPAWNYGLLRTVTAGEKRQVSGRSYTNLRSCSFDVYPAAPRPLQPLVAARLLPRRLKKVAAAILAASPIPSVSAFGEADQAAESLS